MKISNDNDKTMASLLYMFISLSCRASVGFLTRYDEDLREPLVECQVSQVSMRVARAQTTGSREGSCQCELPWRGPQGKEMISTAST